jgi:NADH:ubiquinone oxidoreductase subunit 5 (subunit L)/multisubunit Na+/H+ antiporter MnhA subunit
VLNRALFRALLFICAGVIIIHVTKDSEDIRVHNKMTMIADLRNYGTPLLTTTSHRSKHNKNKNLA